MRIRRPRSEAARVALAKALLEEARNRDSQSAAVVESCFDRQLAFMADTSKWKAVFTPRRSGKSNAVGLYLLQQALLYPKRKSLYIGLTGESAERAIYTEIIQRELERIGIRYDYHGTFRVLTLQNGSTIKIFGLDSSPRDQDRVLGGKYHAVALDEAQSYTQDLGTIIKDKIAPALLDYRNQGGGWLIMGGTPGLYLGDHYWFQVTKQLADGTPDPHRMNGWSVHEWGVADNPFMREEFGTLCQQLREAQGPDYQDDPSFKRQWLGQWVLEPGSRVYKYAESRNTLGRTEADAQIRRELTAGVRFGANGRRWTYVLGCDLGWEDATAIVVGAFNRTEKVFYIVLSEKHRHSVVSQIGALLVGYQRRFGIERMVLDTGGLGRQLAESLRDQFRLPIVAADKREKESTVGLMNSDLLAGRVKILLDANRELAEEWSTLVIDRRRWEASHVWREADRCDNHLADACLYAWRDSYHPFAQEPTARGPEDHADRLIERAKRSRLERMLERAMDSSDVDVSDGFAAERAEAARIVRQHRTGVAARHGLVAETRDGGRTFRRIDR